MPAASASPHPWVGTHPSALESDATRGWTAFLSQLRASLRGGALGGATSPTAGPTRPTGRLGEAPSQGCDVRGREPAVDEERRAVHVRRLVAGQEERAVDDLARLGKTSGGPVDPPPF